MISTSTSQIKLNLPTVMKAQLEEIARSFGYTVSAYLRHLVLSDVEKRKYPVYGVSDRTERITRKAFEDGKWVDVGDVSSYFEKLNQKIK